MLIIKSAFCMPVPLFLGHCSADYQPHLPADVISHTHTRIIAASAKTINIYDSVNVANNAKLMLHHVIAVVKAPCTFPLEALTFRFFPTQLGVLFIYFHIQRSQPTSVCWRTWHSTRRWSSSTPINQSNRFPMN